MRLIEVDAEIPRRNAYSYVSARPMGEMPPEPCRVRLTVLCTPNEAAALLNLLGNDINQPTQAPAPKDRQLPEQGEPEMVRCEVQS